MPRFWSVVTVMILLSGSQVSHGQERADIPDVLKPWMSWVMYGQEFRSCPALGGGSTADSYACAWPGELVVAVTTEGGRFSQPWRLLIPSWVFLPGDEKTWPQSVTSAGRQIPVVLRSGRPAAFLDAGTHVITGSFSWSQRPATLALPETTALVSLRVDNQPVPFPERNGAGLWLGQKSASRQEADTAELKVFRLLEDGSPMVLTTRLILRVSGKAREEVVGTALPSGFVTMNLSSPLPARIEADGGLRIQLRPGTWSIEFRARATADPVELALPPARADWPSQEIWTYVPDTVFRESRLRGPEPIDAEQVGVPPEWRLGASGVVGADNRLSVEERSRGLSEQLTNHLSLQRTLYMDFEGSGYTALDQITGQLRKDWRLDMAAPFELQSARGRQADFLVTLGSTPGSRGVELRDAQLWLSTIARFSGPASGMPVGGWMQDFDQVSTRLQLPPGYHLLAAPGVDKALGAWVNDWTLMDLFLVLLVSVALARLMGRPVGALAIVVLALTHQWMPIITWAMLNLVIAMAVYGAAPEGRLKLLARRYQWIGLAMLVLLVLPFAGELAIKAIYPQLERVGIVQAAGTERDLVRVFPEPGLAEQEMLAQDVATNATAMRSVSKLALESPAAKPVTVTDQRYAPGAVVQTGPGVPEWTWNRYELGWNGPVQPQRTFSLIILRPWATFLWRVLAILGLLGLTGLLARQCVPLPKPRAWLGAGKANGVFLILALCALGSPDEARADLPGPELLKQLQERLLVRPECEPACLEIPSAMVRVGRGNLELELLVHAQAPSMLALPDAGAAWLPRELLLNGEEQSFALLRNGVRYLLVSKGVNRLVLRGQLAPRDLVEIGFTQVPRQVKLQLEGWEAAGLEEGHLTGGSLQLSRKVSPNAPDSSLSSEMAAENYPPFLRVTRTVSLGLEWSVSTRIERLAPARGAISMLIPLLPGEVVVTRDQIVKEGAVVVNLSPDQMHAGWSGGLPAGAGLAFSAPANTQWVETWRIVVGPQWRPSVSGIPGAASDSDGWVMEYYPRPGESIDLSAAKPEAAEGATLAIDHALLRVEPGDEISRNQLQLNWRSTRGGEHRLVLPAGAELLSVSTDGQDLAVSLQDGELVIPVAPGAHVSQVIWNEPRGVSMKWTSSQLELGAATSNLELQVTMPDSRWVLGSFGPRLGPAVLYWGQLLVFLAAALIVSRLPAAPFPFRDWLLLGLGLSMVSWTSLVVFVVWAFAMAWRNRFDDLRKLNNADGIQLMLAFLTVIAIGGVVMAIPQALLGQPDMQIRGWSSHGNFLSWFHDRSSSAMPEVSVISLSIWAYKAAMLAWALWLSVALVRWLRWGWEAWSRGGHWLGKVGKTSEPPG
jgi:hypothetical protein